MREQFVAPIILIIVKLQVFDILKAMQRGMFVIRIVFYFAWIDVLISVNIGYLIVLQHLTCLAKKLGLSLKQQHPLKLLQ